mgnify:CR=1 FL=1
MENLDALVLRYSGALEGQTADRLESDYLQVLELTLLELAQAEREGGACRRRARNACAPPGQAVEFKNRRSTGESASKLREMAESRCS